MDTGQDSNPPDSGWKDKSGDAHPHSPNSDMKDRCNITQDIKKHDMEDVRAIYKDIHSPDSGSNGNGVLISRDPLRGHQSFTKSIMNLCNYFDNEFSLIFV